MTPHFEGRLGNKQLGVGAVDVQAPNVETGEQVAERIRAHRWLAPEQTIITSSCGLNHLPRHIAFGKLRAMTEAKAILGGGTRTDDGRSRRPPRTASNGGCAQPRSGSASRRSPAASAGSSGT